MDLGQVYIGLIATKDAVKSSKKIAYVSESLPTGNCVARSFLAPPNPPKIQAHRPQERVTANHRQRIPRRDSSFSPYFDARWTRRNRACA